jgi:hypothetical protein
VRVSENTSKEANRMFVSSTLPSLRLVNLMGREMGKNLIANREWLGGTRTFCLKNGLLKRCTVACQSIQMFQNVIKHEGFLTNHF